MSRDAFSEIDSPRREMGEHCIEDLPYSQESRLLDEQCHHRHESQSPASKDRHSITEKKQHSTVPVDISWTPYALSYLYMGATLSYGIAMLIIVVSFHAISSRHSGITDDTDTSLLYFSWRFAPTLLAVIYVMILMIVLDAVKQTECFARLSRHDGSPASASILRPPGAWWNTLADSLPRKRNDHHFDPTSFCITLAYIMSTLILSPFTAAFLSPQNVAVSATELFDRVLLASEAGLQPSMSALEYFHTIGHVLQNVTTSPWISDEFAVLPMWPVGQARPEGSRISGPIGTWEAESLVFQSTMECEELQVVRGPSQMNVTYSTPGFNSSLAEDADMSSLLFASESGCKYGVAYGPLRLFIDDQNSDTESLVRRLEIAVWSNVSTAVVPGFGQLMNPEYDHPENKDLLLNYTSECVSGEVMIFISFKAANSSPSIPGISGQWCQSKYHVAHLPVRVAVTSADTIVEIDSEAFRHLKQPVSTEMLKLSKFELEFLNSTWREYIGSGLSDTRPILGGPAHLLAAQSKFNISEIMKRKNITNEAAKIRQRAFGQALHSSFGRIDKTVQVHGRTITDRRRIVVNTTVALVIETSLSLIILLTLLTWWFSRPCRRPLGLAGDPGFANTIASMISADDGTRRVLGELLRSQSHDPRGDNIRTRFKVKQGSLQLKGPPPEGPEADPRTLYFSSSTQYPRWRSKILSSYTLLALAIALASMIAGTVSLYCLSRKKGFLSATLTRRITIGDSEAPLARLAPYSIVPTLLAVLVGLWWGALEKTFRTVQPYISMAKRPTLSVKGSGLSYQSSYLLWASGKAIRRRHWLLALICIGATVSQILTITFSALWDRKISRQMHTYEVQQALHLRQVPHLTIGFVYRDEEYKKPVLGMTFEDLKSNWMYSAALQLSQNASEPSWSKDGWSFVPISIGGETWQPIPTNATVTVDVPAIRARAECSPLTGLDQKYWLTERNLSESDTANSTSQSRRGRTGYSVGCSHLLPMINFSPNTSLSDNCMYSDIYTNALPTYDRVSCCSGSADGTSGQASFGYWSHVYNDSAYDVPDIPSFVVKWIHGPAPSDHQEPQGYNSIVWPKPPRLSMLNCRPIIEVSTARVTVDATSHQVHEYALQSVPSPYPFAWMDNYAKWGPGGAGDKNITTSFGVLFVDALLGASQLKSLGPSYFKGGGPEPLFEDDDDRTFNIKMSGLNTDYMSYSMLALSHFDHESLLDLKHLETVAQKTFTTFFAHFASTNVAVNGSGNWVFQRRDETMPDLPPDDTPKSFKTAPSKLLESSDPIVTAILSYPVEAIHVSPLAAWLSVAMLLWLILTTIAILLMKTRYFSPLRHNIETVADVAKMIVNSEAYRELAGRKGASGLREDRKFRTKLGWFRTKTGELHWGIELADDHETEFLDDNEVKTVVEYANRKSHPQSLL